MKLKCNAPGMCGVPISVANEIVEVPANGIVDVSEDIAALLLPASYWEVLKEDEQKALEAAARLEASNPPKVEVIPEPEPAPKTGQKAVGPDGRSPVAKKRRGRKSSAEEN